MTLEVDRFAEVLGCDALWTCRFTYNACRGSEVLGQCMLIPFGCRLEPFTTYMMPWMTRMSVRTIEAAYNIWRRNREPGPLQW